MCGKRERRDGEVFAFLFLCFVLYHVKISMMKTTLAMCVWVMKCSEGLAMNRQQVVIAVASRQGLAHLVSYLSVTHSLSPPLSYLPHHPAVVTHLLVLWDMKIQLGWL